ncbi:MAG TPA: hypothetical protein VK753_05440 [Xanthomonadaceae bacterium]|jgi:hypothetical protein|nr:hypothetical protein [Xanthomonadaceae bacterium]
MPMRATRYASLDHAAQLVYGGSAFVFAVAALLWVFADRVAKLALARPQQVVFESDVSVSEWQGLAFSVVGLWQTIDGLTFLSGRIVRLAIVHLAVGSGAPSLLPDDFYEWVAADGLRLVIGIGLLFGSRGLVGMIRKYRQVGYMLGDPSEAQHSNAAGATDSGPTPPT